MKDSRLDHEPPLKGEPTAVASLRAAARGLALGSPDIEALRETTKHIVTGRDAFDEAFCSHLLEHEDQRRAWVTALRAAIRGATADLSGLGDEGDVERVEAELERWKREVDPFAIWEVARDDVHFDSCPIVELRRLLLLDRKAWLAELDALPVPSLMWDVVWMSSIAEDPDLIEELMVQAPPLFDANGAWTRSACAPIFAQLIQTYAGRVQNALARRTFTSAGPAHSLAERALKAFEEEELPARLHRFYEALLARADGRAIAYGLLTDLAPRGIAVPEREGSSRWSIARAALDALSSALAASGASVEQARGFWEQINARKKAHHESSRNGLHRPDKPARRRIDDREGEGARTLYADGFPLLLGATAILSKSTPKDAEAERLWSWFDSLLTGRDPGLRLATGDATLMEASRRLGAALALLVDPVPAWRATYKRLEPQRRRGQFSSRYEGDSHLDRESVFLIYAGLHGCVARSEKLAAGESHASLHGFFWSLYDSARRLWLITAHDIGGHKRNLVAACFAFIPGIFGGELGTALERALRPIANDSWLFARACSYLRLNGVTPERLRQIMDQSGFRLDAALRDAHEWAGVTGLENEFPHDFQDLTRILGYELESPRAAHAPDAPLQRNRSLFESRVPWARALLDRLDVEGCTLTRLDAFDEGPTWLVQVQVPRSLQADFGLAPELRILAVTGWFDGRDFDRAHDDPEGITAVDPDLLVVANDRPDLRERLALLPGPWGQRIPWSMADRPPAPLTEQLREHLPEFDLFERRDPVRGRQLIGRRDLIANLCSRLVRGQAVGVFGLRKVGKSSLLDAVAGTLDPARLARPDAEVRALVISLDVQGIVGRTVDALARRLAETLRKRLHDAGLLGAPAAPGDLVVSDVAPQDDRPIEELERLVRLALVRSTLPVCIILDEYDLLFSGYGGEPGFVGVERLFGLLRALAQETGRVAVALIGRDPVFVERPLLGGFTNPLLGWVVPSWLGPLRRSEADQLLTRLGRRVGLAVGPETLETAWCWTGGHPLLHRQFGSALLEVARRCGEVSPVSTDPLCEESVAVFLDRDAVHTIVSEVKALLASRFPDALALLHDLAEVNGHGPDAALEPHDGWSGDAARVLRNFGLIAGTSDHPTMAEAIRRRMARATPARGAKGRRRNLRHGA